MSRHTWYTIKAQAEEAELWLYDEIGGWGIRASELLGQLPRDGQRLSVHIHSPGGDVWEGLAIYEALRAYTGEVTVYIDGLAASMASVIAMAADRVVIGSLAYFMIHDPWVWLAGDADELRKSADLLDKIKETIISAYRRKSNKSRAEIAEAMKEETWLDAGQALEWGLAEELSESLKAAAKVRLDKLADVPQKVKELYAMKDEPIAPAGEAEDVTPTTNEPETPQNSAPNTPAADSGQPAGEAGAGAPDAENQPDAWQEGYDACKRELTESLRTDILAELASERGSIQAKLATATETAEAAQTLADEKDGENKRLREQLAAAHAKLKGLAAGFRYSPDEQDASDGTATGAEFWAAVARIEADESVDHDMAIRLATYRHPDLHKAMIQDANKGTSPRD